LACVGHAERKPASGVSELPNFLARIFFFGSASGHRWIHAAYLDGQGDDAPADPPTYREWQNDRRLRRRRDAYQVRETGIMTFMTGVNGVVYERDLGPDTAKVAASIQEFDPPMIGHRSSKAPRPRLKPDWSFFMSINSCTRSSRGMAKYFCVGADRGDAGLAACRYSPSRRRAVGTKLLLMVLAGIGKMANSRIVCHTVLPLQDSGRFTRIWKLSGIGASPVRTCRRWWA